MVESGNWITPRLNGIKYFEKPPLQYWTTALAYRAFGMSDWTARLWPAAHRLSWHPVRVLHRAPAVRCPCRYVRCRSAGKHVLLHCLRAHCHARYGRYVFPERGAVLLSPGHVMPTRHARRRAVDAWGLGGDGRGSAEQGTDRYIASRHCAYRLLDRAARLVIVAAHTPRQGRTFVPGSMCAVVHQGVCGESGVRAVLFVHEHFARFAGTATIATVPFGIFCPSC